jgi:hypothetical protein
MAGVRFADLRSRPTEFLDFTSLTLDEFQRLIPPFEAAFQAYMVAWRLDGKPRTTRQCTVYKNCLLPTAADRPLFILAHIKTYALQVVQGRMYQAPWLAIWPGIALSAAVFGCTMFSDAPRDLLDPRLRGGR